MYACVFIQQLQSIFLSGEDFSNITDELAIKAELLFK